MRRRRSLEDLDGDIRDHLERETADNIDRGMTPSDARDAALRKFGNVALAKEEARAVWIPTWVDQLLQDMRYALRMFSRTPGFSVIVVLTLALGIGATTAIFSVVNNLLLTPPAFKHADRLVYLVDTNPEKVPPDADTPPSPGNMLDWRERMRSVDAMAAWRNWYYAVSSVDAGPGTPESVRGVRVSRLFSLCSAWSPHSAGRFATKKKCRAQTASSCFPIGCGSAGLQATPRSSGERFSSTAVRRR